MARPSGCQRPPGEKPAPWGVSVGGLRWGCSLGVIVGGGPLRGVSVGGGGVRLEGVLWGVLWRGCLLGRCPVGGAGRKRGRKSATEGGSNSGCDAVGPEPPQCARLLRPPTSDTRLGAATSPDSVGRSASVHHGLRLRAVAAADARGGRHPTRPLSRARALRNNRGGRVAAPGAGAGESLCDAPSESASSSTRCGLTL